MTDSQSPATDDAGQNTAADKAPSETASVGSASQQTAETLDPVNPPPTPLFGKPGAPLNQRSPFFMGFTGALGVLLAWVFYQALVDVWSMLILIGVSVFLAIALNPTVIWLQRLRLPRGVAVAVVALGVLGFLVGVVFALGPPIVDQGSQLIDKAPGYIEDLKNNKTINDLNERFNLIDRLSDAASGDMVSSVFGGVIGGLGILASAVFNILTGFILTLYFLASFNRLKSGAYKLVPASRRERVQLLGDEMLGRIGKYLSGALAIALIAGCSTLIFAEITDIPYSFALAMVVAITDLIPQIGATLGAIVVSAVAFTVSVPVGIAAIVFFIAYQQIENFLIYPKVMKRAVNVSDLAAIISALIGAALLGVVGALLAIPVCAALQLLVREVIIPRQEVN